MRFTQEMVRETRQELKKLIKKGEILKVGTVTKASGQIVNVYERRHATL